MLWLCAVITSKMAASQLIPISKVLEDLNMQMFADRFEAEKITPYIVCKLSAREIEALVISGRADMMRRRTECVKYGTDKPERVNSVYNIPKSELENLLEHDFTVSDISKMLSVSESTVYRRMT